MKTYTLASVEYKSLDESGTFEALAAVFGNVDAVGDRLMPGAFTDTLRAWQTKASPIPLYFSHGWKDSGGPASLDIGEVLDAYEVDQGLYVKGRIDLAPEEEFARRIYKRMRKGTLREWSFAYRAKRERPGTNGAKRDLLAVDLIELGPTFKGVNDSTQTLTIKSETDDSGEKDAEKVAEATQALRRKHAEMFALWAERTY